jgi:hypothetical protein
MTLITVLEIFTNPKDLEISILQEKKGGKYGLVIITRGPGHDFKPLLTVGPFAEKFRDILKAVEKTLKQIQTAARSELGKMNSSIARFVNPDGKKIDESRVLNDRLVKRIMALLRKHKVASTYKFKKIS